MEERGCEKLTHMDEGGRARMVDVGGKDVARREAVARASVRMGPETLALVTRGELPKGDVFQVARLAAIMAAKKTPELIPLCHPLRIDSVSVDIRPEDDRSGVLIESRVLATDRTGVEMEALTAAAVAALTVYDMCKAVDRGMEIARVRLISKKGGKSGGWVREEEA